MNPFQFEDMSERVEVYEEMLFRGLIALERIAAALEEMVPPKKVGLIEFLTGKPFNWGPPSAP